MSDLSEEEIKVFADAVDHYFLHVTSESAAVRGAYLGGTQTPPPIFDFTGHSAVSGAYEGCILVSAPRAMIRHLLLAMHEADHSDDMLRDAIGELTNTLAGNARRHFGESMEISVPTTYRAPWQPQPPQRARPYVIIVNWRHYDASMIVDIERRS